jgi:hypothetical protein
MHQCIQLPNRTTKIVDQNPWRDDEPYFKEPLHDGPTFKDGGFVDDDDFDFYGPWDSGSFLSSVRLSYLSIKSKHINADEILSFIATLKLYTLQDTSQMLFIVKDDSK